MTITSKRAEQVGWLGLGLSILVFVFAIFIGSWSGFFAIKTLSWLSLAWVMIWFVLVIQFHQRSLAEQEKLDISQLSKAKDGSTIFHAQDESVTMLAVAQNRLDVFEKWFVPIFSFLISIYEIAIGFYLLRELYYGIEAETINPLTCLFIIGPIIFFSFLLSRLVTGMSTEMKWKPLRAAGSVGLAVTILGFALVIGLGFAHFNYYSILTVLSWVTAGLIFLLGIETAANTILDRYRPRLKGQYNRSGFDSRILGVINEPGGIFHSLASAIDYQFGFKVSHTWFYKLMVKAVVPLTLFSAVVLYLMSSIVIIDVNEEAIVEHFGKAKTSSGHVRQIGPGLHLKWPWPVDSVSRYSTQKIREVSIGFVPKSLKEGERPQPYLWGKEHYESEDMLLVASKQSTGAAEEGAVPVSIVIAAVPVQYRVKDLYSFIYNYGKVKKRIGKKRFEIYQAEELLKGICYRELTQFAASAKIEVDESADTDDSLLGAGRIKAKKILSERIQQAVDQAGLGIEVVFVGLQGVHPPPAVASDYQDVVGAVQKKQAEILSAQADAIASLANLAGSVSEADKLSELSAAYQRAQENNDTEKINQLAMELDVAFAQAKGDIFETLRLAQGYAFERVSLARASGERFAGQLKAYRASPEFYKRQQRLFALEAMKDIRKTIVVADDDDKQVIIVDLKEKLAPSLYDIGGIEENDSK